MVHKAFCDLSFALGRQENVSIYMQVTLPPAEQEGGCSAYNKTDITFTYFCTHRRDEKKMTFLAFLGKSGKKMTYIASVPLVVHPSAKYLSMGSS